MDGFQENDLINVPNEKIKLYSSLQEHLLDTSDVTKRRSSSRSIKRKKFDDELVEYSLGLQNINPLKNNRTRTQSMSEYNTGISPTTSPNISTTTSPNNAIDVKKKIPSKVLSNFPKRTNKKGRQQNQITTKDLGRWKPTDDLALIIGVQQTNDLRAVHLGTKFSCKFSIQELQQRWYALLYDPAVSRVAVSAMRNLHPDLIASVQDKALWSESEENILNNIKSTSNPSMDVFIELLGQNSDIFYSGRTANALYRHWQTMKMYHLLSDQMIGPLPYPGRPVMTFNDAEDHVQECDLNEPTDDILDREVKLQQRKNIKHIRNLEGEISRWNILVDSVTGICPGELDRQTLAVFRGRMVRYLMRSKEIIIGRCAKGFNVDIDLTLEGPSHKISRRQGTLRLRNTGEFYLTSEGKRPIFVDGKPIAAGNKVRLYDNAVVEIACLRFIFNVNLEIIRSIYDSIKYNMA